MKARTIKPSRMPVVHPLQTEQGSALLVTLLSIVLLTVLGLVLLQFVQQGMKSSTAQEGQIMAEALAQKGLDEALATVESAVEAANGISDYRDKANWLETNINAILNTLPGTFPGADGKGSYSVEMESSAADLKSTPLGRVRALPDYPYVRKITVTCTGRTKLWPAVTVSRRMEMYVSSINPVMRYALSANVDDSLLSLPAGDPRRTAIQLNGAPYIVGNIFAGGDLSVSDKALFMKEPGVEGQIDTSLPTLRGFYKAVGNTRTTGSSLFADASVPLEDAQLQPAERVDVQNTVNQALARYLSGSDVQSLLPVPLEDPQVSLSGDLPGGKHYDQAWVTVNGTARLTAPSPGQSADVLISGGLLDMLEGSSLKISGGSLLVDAYDPDLVVANLAGRLQLDEGQAAVIRGNAVINDGFRLDSGSLFVQGDLKIYGNVNLFGTVYVDGNVELRDLASINGSCSGGEGEEEGEGKTCPPLIIAASGAIELGEYVQDQGSTIHAFLYANGPMKLYGVYSKLNFIGGLHADEGLELNAVKGGLQPVAGAADSDPVWNRYTLPNQSAQPETASRLDVTHDMNLYETPPAGIPVTDTFNVYVSQLVFDKN